MGTDSSTSIKGLPIRQSDDPMEATAFRTSWTQSQGLRPPRVLECRIIDINMVEWTVDCISVFDRRRYFGIQVASPYMHFNSGEGIYVMPDVAAKCYVCIPSDGPPPFVLAFLMPPEGVNTSSPDAPAGTNAQTGGSQSPTGSTYAGGRTKAKPGDIVLKGRDGNFVILHRGGVLQLGTSPLAQRIFVPLGNLVTDISQNYSHFNTGGSVNWGIRPGSPDENPETEYRETFRVFANDKFADVRLCIGKVHTPVPEPTGSAGLSEDMAGLGISEVPILELIVAPQGFETVAGTLSSPSTREATVLKFHVDTHGGVILRSESSIIVRSKEKLRLVGDKGIELITSKGFSVSAGESASITGGSSLDLSTNGGVVKLNGGSKPVATVGSMVNVTVTVPIPIVTSNGPGTISAGAVLTGMISTGNPTVLA